MRFRLRTLMIVLAIGPPMLAPYMMRGWREYVAWRNKRDDPGPGYLGVSFVTTNGGGVMVIEVRPGCAAEAAGLSAGDVITAYNNRPCGDQDEFWDSLSKSKAGEEFTMTVKRDRQETTVRTKLRPMPSSPWLAPAYRNSATYSNP